MTTTKAQTVTVTADYISCGIRVISVEPYRTETRYGQPVEVWEFKQDADGSGLISVEGFKVKKNGETHARAGQLMFVDVPDNIAAMLR
jgi:hypothetical protein